MNTQQKKVCTLQTEAVSAFKNLHKLLTPDRNNAPCLLSPISASDGVSGCQSAVICRLTSNFPTACQIDAKVKKLTRSVVSWDSKAVILIPRAAVRRAAKCHSHPERPAPARRIQISVEEQCRRPTVNKQSGSEWILLLHPASVTNKDMSWNYLMKQLLSSKLRNHCWYHLYSPAQ